MGCFVVARFLLTSASRGPSANSRASCKTETTVDTNLCVACVYIIQLLSCPATLDVITDRNGEVIARYDVTRIRLQAKLKQIAYGVFQASC